MQSVNDRGSETSSLDSEGVDNLKKKIKDFEEVKKSDHNLNKIPSNNKELNY